MENKLLGASEAVEKYIKSGSTIVVSGFQTSAVGIEMLKAISDAYESTGEPRDLTVISGATPEVDVLAKEGLLKRIIMGSYLFCPDMAKLLVENKVEGYNIPQGVLAQIFRDIANRNGGMATKIGFGTFVDPRLSGGKMNTRTTEDIVEVRDILGESNLFYKCPNIDVAILRATGVDELGNASFANEAAYSFAVAAAIATKACGGKVILECRDYVKAESLAIGDVKLAHIFVDAVVLDTDPNDDYMVSRKSYYSPSLLGKYQVAQNPGEFLDMSPLKVVARRAAMEMGERSFASIGAGAPAAISNVVSEEGCTDLVSMAMESGMIGGASVAGEPFGYQNNQKMIVDEPYYYDLIHTGILDVAYIDLLQADEHGKVNSSMLGDFIAGCGPSIDAAFGAKKIVFCAPFSNDAEVAISDGKVTVARQGSHSVFVRSVEQVTIDGMYELSQGKSVRFITERGVFDLADDGLVLVEVAPGIDIERDILEQMPFAPKVASDVKMMDPKVFAEPLMGLAGFLSDAN